MTMTLADTAVDDGVMGPRSDRPKRRVFTAEYKAQILAEYDAAESLSSCLCKAFRLGLVYR